ncbi:hypothetical protein KOW79_015412 [Hemibagrus wyckioides]|uniref:Uncharacterized protein n=1 Tax=Hemibagrus wyckioides TaxID=337641 RepID=A0A9D3NEW4_9TELE|nr:hypothetical protein KOW79_015412 [Hemibagrus wyckioides]
MQRSAREKGEQEEAVFTEGAAEPAASSGPVSEEVAGPSNKEVQLTQAEGGSSDLTPGESLTAGQVTPAVGVPSGEEQASRPSLGLDAALFGSWAEATEGVAEASTLVQPDWASMEFSDGMEDVGSDPEQDMGEGGRLSGTGVTTEAEGATEERRIKRSRLERGREFDLLTVGDIIGTREIEVEGARAVHTLGEDCLQWDGGTREEEGWTQVVARRVRTGAGRGGGG